MYQIKILFIFLITFLFFSGCFDLNYNSDNYSIQKAIDDAKDGDPIYIKSGIYYETLIINKSIDLIGEGEDLTIIDCKNSGKERHIDTIIINANNCSIQGLKITNTHVSSNVIGININSSNNIIINNSISRFNKGIYLNENTKNNKIYGNLIFNNQNGINLNFSFYNNISNNNLSRIYIKQ